MKVEYSEIEIKRSEEFEDKQFGIGDVSIVLEILRSKLYSNKVRAVCQEIMSNARDAHREMNKEDVPICVKLPSVRDTAFYIQDFGQGITPDRMKDVYILYGQSTKRNDNTQTGGFGIGSKTPWAYSDTFTITTITNETGKNIKRYYIAYIDETRIGKLSLVNHHDTDEPTGTTIGLDVKREDIHEFISWVRYVSHFWKVRPNIVGNADFKWETIKYDFDYDDWKIPHDYNHETSSILYCRPLVVLDGIPYVLDASSVSKENRIDKLVNNYVRIFLNTGDVRIVASRDALDYSDKNGIDKINQKLNGISDILGSIVQDKLKNAKNFATACCLAQQYTKYIDISQIKWQNTQRLLTNYELRYSECEMYHYRSQRTYNRRSYRTSYISFYDSSVDEMDFYVDTFDSPEPARSKVEYLFTQNNKLTDIYVVKIKQDKLAELESKTSFLTLFTPKDLINVTIPKKPRQPRPGVKQTKVFMLEERERSWGWKKFGQDIDRSVGLDKQVYVLYSDNEICDMTTTAAGQAIFDYRPTIMDFQKKYGIKVWGIPKRFENFAKSLQILSLKEFITQQITSIQQNDPKMYDAILEILKGGYEQFGAQRMYYYHFGYISTKKAFGLFDDPELRKYFEQSYFIHEKFSENQKEQLLIKTAVMLNLVQQKPDSELEVLSKKLASRYPVFGSLDRYYHSDTEEYKETIWYLNQKYSFLKTNGKL